MEAGKILREMRISKNLTQQKVAEDIGVVQSAYAMYESGQRTPGDDMKMIIADYFNSSVQDIFFKR